MARIKNDTAFFQFKQGMVTVGKTDDEANSHSLVMTPADWKRFNKWYKKNAKKLVKEIKAKKLKKANRSKSVDNEKLNLEPNVNPALQ